MKTIPWLSADESLHPVVRSGVKQLVNKGVKDALHQKATGGGSVTPHSFIHSFIHSLIHSSVD